jgi:hypothetical protein
MKRIILCGLSVVALGAGAGCSNPNFNCTGTCNGVPAAAQVIQAANADDACTQLKTNITNAGCTGIPICTLCVQQ